MPEKEKKIRIVVTELNDDKEDKVLHDDVHKGVVMLAENTNGGCMEMLVNTRILDLAAMIASSEKVSVASDLAHLMKKCAKQMEDDPEDTLADIIRGGLQ